MKRSYQEIPNICSLEQLMRKKAALDLANLPKCDNMPLDNPKDLINLGGENFVTVQEFIGHTRVHIRRYISEEDSGFNPTKDGVSISPKVWYSLRREIQNIVNHRSCDKVFVIDRDLCISKQIKDGVQVFIFQRLFQRKNMCLDFVPERVVLNNTQIEKLIQKMPIVTDGVKNGLITYTLFYCIEKELKNSNLQLKLDNSVDGFLQLLLSLKECLRVSISIKISELINCFGCRESHLADFMHDCKVFSREQKWEQYFELALYSIDMNSLARDILQKNLNIDFNRILYEQDFFDSLIVSELFTSIQKLYVDDELDDNLIIC